MFVCDFCPQDKHKAAVLIVKNNLPFCFTDICSSGKKKKEKKKRTLKEIVSRILS